MEFAIESRSTLQENHRMFFVFVKMELPEVVPFSKVRSTTAKLVEFISILTIPLTGSKILWSDKQTVSSLPSVSTGGKIRKKPGRPLL